MDYEKLKNFVMNKEVYNITMLFQQNSELLDLQKSREDLDDAIGLLASWIHWNAHELTEDDFLSLILIGGIMYRKVQKIDTSHQNPIL
jgi:hypothetical protein